MGQVGPSKGRVEGVEGYASRGDMPGMGSAENIGGIAGGAAIGFALAGPVGALAGAIYGVVKMFQRFNTQMSKQMEFEAYERLGDAVNKASDTLDKFNQSQTVTASGVAAVNRDVGDAFNLMRDANLASVERGTVEKSQFGAMGAGGGALAGAVIGTMIAPGIGTAVGAIAGALIGGFIEKSLGSTKAAKQETALEAANKSLELFSDNFIEKIGKAFEKITDSFIKNVADVQRLDMLGALIVSFEDAERTIGQTNADFDLLNRTLQKSGREGENLANFLNTKLMASMVEGIKGGSDDLKKVYTAALAMDIDLTDTDRLKHSLTGLAHHSGMSEEAVEKQVASLASLTQRSKEQITQEIALKARMEALNRAMKRSEKIVSLFTIAFERLAKAGDEASSRFGLFASELDNMFSRRLDNQFGIQDSKILKLLQKKLYKERLVRYQV